MFARCSDLFHSIFLRRKGSERNETPQILAVLQEGPEQALLEAISKERGWSVAFCHDVPTAEALAPIVLYERASSTLDWQPAVRALTKRTPRPYVILLSHHVNLNLWDEVQRNGGSDLLRLPFSREIITKAVSRAWRIWTNQNNLRAAGSQTLKQLPSSLT